MTSSSSIFRASVMVLGFWFSDFILGVMFHFYLPAVLVLLHTFLIALLVSPVSHQSSLPCVFQSVSFPLSLSLSSVSLTSVLFCFPCLPCFSSVPRSRLPVGFYLLLLPESSRYTGLFFVFRFALSVVQLVDYSCVVANLYYLPYVLDFMDYSFGCN